MGNQRINYKITNDFNGDPKLLTAYFPGFY